MQFAVNEDDGMVTPILAINKPSSFKLKIYVEVINKTALGKLYVIYCMDKEHLRI